MTATLESRPVLDDGFARLMRDVFGDEPPYEPSVAEDERRILFPVAGPSEPGAIAIAARLARDEGGVLVPALLRLVPLRHDVGSVVAVEDASALPLLTPVRRAAFGASVPVEVRVAQGRTFTDCLRKLWSQEPFHRLVVSAPADGRRGLTQRDLRWVLKNSPIETIVWRATPAAARIAA